AREFPETWLLAGNERAEPSRRRIPDYRYCRYQWVGGRAAVSRPGERTRSDSRSFVANQPLRICLVRRIHRGIYRAGFLGETLSNPSAGVHGLVLARSCCRLRHRTDWLSAFWRRRLWYIHETALGYEFSKRRGSDNRESSSNSHLRISDLDINCRDSVAGRTKSPKRRSGRKTFFLLLDFDGCRAVFNGVHSH